MAHHSATKKSIRQIATRTARNIVQRSQVKNSVKKVITAIEAGDHAVATEALRAAQSTMFKAVNDNIVKKHTAARKISRLNAAVKAIAKK